MKSTTIIVVGLFLISSFTAISLGEEAGEYQETINHSFSNLEVKNSDIESFIELNYEGANGHLYQQNQPILPLYRSKTTLPFGVEIVDVQCNIGNVQTMELSNKIIPAPDPVIKGVEISRLEYTKDETIYNSNELFPNNWYDYYVGVGLDENMDHKTFLITRTFPVRYNPVTNEIKYVEDIELTITYSEPLTNPFPSMVDYELVIIAPQKFSSDLQKLITHKENKGVSTLLMTTEDIYSQYTGVDKPEQIKYFIKDALETYNTQYVLLVGGLKSIIYGKPRDDRNQGTKDWLLPVRYTNLRDEGSTYDPGFLSDLYYADIYKEGGAFEDWDSDGNGIFAKWDNTPGKDIIDFYPDVAVGRLACRNNLEVKIVVNKIINYEKTQAPASWYNKMILAGGDSFNDVGTNYLEGEVVSERIIDDYMDEFTPIKMYASNKDTNPSMTPTGTNISKKVTQGAGHFFLDGHASPYTWTTHWPGEFEGPDSWTERFWVWQFPKLWNFGKLPVCCVEGCHNSQFNQSILAGMDDKDNSKKMYVYGQPIPECWSWWLARKIGGGTISTIGNSGLGYGAVGEHGDLDGDGITEEDVLEAFGGLYFDQFYLQFDAGYDILGETHAMALASYMDLRPGMGDKIDAKTMEQMTLLGDPSLKIRGYPGVAGLKVFIKDGEAGILGAPSEEIMLQAIANDGQGEITYSWDLDNDGVYDDAQGDVASKSWIIPGVYWVSVKATDESGESNTYDTIIGIEIGADKPAKPTGETIIKAGVEYTYEASVNTQGGYWNNVYYKFSWDDGTETDWIETSSATHSWDQKGTYKVKVKALLTHDDAEEDFKETDWSDALRVTLQKSKPRQVTLFELIQSFLENHPNAFPILRQLLGL